MQSSKCIVNFSLVKQFCQTELNALSEATLRQTGRASSDSTDRAPKCLKCRFSRGSGVFRQINGHCTEHERIFKKIRFSPTRWIRPRRSVALRTPVPCAKRFACAFGPTPRQHPHGFDAGNRGRGSKHSWPERRRRRHPFGRRNAPAPEHTPAAARPLRPMLAITGAARIIGLQMMAKPATRDFGDPRGVQCVRLRS